jgi:hypothetical protein
VHVRQCEAWGPLFVPAYLAASLAAAARGRSFYYDNRFEVQAYAADSAVSTAGSAVTTTSGTGINHDRCP